MYHFLFITNSRTLYLLLLDSNKQELFRIVTTPAENLLLAKTRLVRQYTQATARQLNVARELLEQAIVASRCANAIAKQFLSEIGDQG